MQTKLITSLLFMVAILHGALPTETDTLKDSYTAAVKKATDPLNTVYKSQLNILLEKYKKLNDLAEVAKIVAELKTVGVEVDLEDATKNPLSKNGSVEKLFVNKVWVSPLGTEYHFLSNGGGYRKSKTDKTNLVWELNDGIVKITTRETATKESPVSNWFFRFTDSKTAFYGKSVDSISQPLIRTQ